MLATGSFDATVGIWRRWDSYGKEEGGGPVTANGVSGRQDGDDGEDGEEDEDEEWRFAVLLDGHDSEVKSVSWSPSGSLLATCSRDKSIWIWEDLDDGDNNFETVAVLQEHSGDVKCVAWHPVEECLASASYDDTIRLWREDIDDWGQIACLKGHDGTVWAVDWEAVERDISSQIGHSPQLENDSEVTASAKIWNETHSATGPRLVSCSDDRTIRIWRRQMLTSSTGSRTMPGSMPSIIRPTGIDETWVEETQLPKVHDLSIYAVAWSKKTGLLASTGADGRIVVYQEQLVTGGNSNANASNDENSVEDSDKMDVEPTTTTTTTDTPAPAPESIPKTEWTVLASIEAAHGIYEVNHICWARRADRKGRNDGKGRDRDEEVLLTTGDDGGVKAWRVSDGYEKSE